MEMLFHADDFIEMEINLQDYIVKNKEATFCVKVEILKEKIQSLYLFFLLKF